MTTTILTEDFNRLIDGTKTAVAKTDTKPIHMWIRLELSGTTATAVGVDGYRMNIQRAACYDLDEDFTAYIKPTMKKFPRNMFVNIELLDKKLILSCGDDIVGFKQPDGEFLEWKKTYDDIAKSEPVLRMGFNAKYMYEAIASLKATTPDFYREPVILEAFSPLQPAILRSKSSGERIVLPVRLKS